MSSHTETTKPLTERIESLRFEIDDKRVLSPALAWLCDEMDWALDLLVARDERIRALESDNARLRDLIGRFDALVAEQDALLL